MNQYTAIDLFSGAGGLHNKVIFDGKDKKIKLK